MATDRYGRTELMLAAIARDVERASTLIKSGVDLDSADKNGWTALHFAAQNQDVEIANWLLTAGAAIDPRDAYGNTPLSKAVFNFRDDGRLIELLLSYGADRHLENNHGVSAYSLSQTIANYDSKPFLKAT